MNELLKKDITIKAISILFAVILWFFVLDSHNPIGTKTIVVPLKVINDEMLQEKDIVIKNKNYSRNIEVVVKGRKEKINSISSNDFEAILDFSKVTSVDYNLLSVDGPTYVGKEDRQDVQILEVKPRQIKLELDKIEKNPFRVEVVPSGKVKENYKIIKMLATPETVSIQNIGSLIKSVGAVKAFVDVNNLDRELIAKKECKVYNKSGEEITELGKNLTVEIRVEVAKEVPVVPYVKGKPAKNFIDGQKIVKPEKVLITGAPEILAGISEIKTEAVDIENASSSIDIMRLVNLPEGVKLYNSVREVAVSVAVEQLGTREFSVTKDDITLHNTEIDNSLKYEIQNPNINISIKGAKADLDKLDITRIKPSIDVDKLGEGLHKQPLAVALPDNVKLADEYFIEVKIDKR